jgi:hypothetical protein
MMPSGRLYDFAFRGFLTREALDQISRRNRGFDESLDEKIASRLPLESLDETMVGAARQMATVYVAIAAFENSARQLISKVLLEKVGANWWETSVAAGIRKKVEGRQSEEAKFKWHKARGGDPIDYTDFGDLGNIVGQNWAHFEDLIPSLEWVKSLFDVVERSRNVIMHTGTLGLEDIERVGINIRDWIKQVGV